MGVGHGTRPARAARHARPASVYSPLLVCQCAPLFAPAYAPFSRPTARPSAPQRRRNNMRIDAYTHFLPRKFYDSVLNAGDHRDIGKRMKGVPAIYDLDVRLKIVDSFPDYAQILSYPTPPLEAMTDKAGQVEDYARMVNDGFAELCARHPDQFPGFVAQTSLAAPDAGVRETERAI